MPGFEGVLVIQQQHYRQRDCSYVDDFVILLLCTIIAVSSLVYSILVFMNKFPVLLCASYLGLSCDPRASGFLPQAEEHNVSTEGRITKGVRFSFGHFALSRAHD